MSAHTPGPWELSYDKGSTRDVIASNGSEPICMVRQSWVSREAYQANAQLIAEAGTVATETGLTPRQLAEQRAELLEALKAIHVQAADAQLRATYQRIALEEISQRAQSAIAKCGVKP